VVPRFLVQFGISYTTDLELKRFARGSIPDDPKHDPPINFREGIVSYAGSGPNSRNSQLFISYGSAASLGRELWETPIGEVVEGIESVRSLYSGYGDMPPWGKGPVQGKIHAGPEYILESYPKLDSFQKCSVKRSTDIDIPPPVEDDKKNVLVLNNALEGELDSNKMKSRLGSPSGIEYISQPSTISMGLGLLAFLAMTFLIFTILQKRHKKDDNKKV